MKTRAPSLPASPGQRRAGRLEMRFPEGFAKEKREIVRALLLGKFAGFPAAVAGDFMLDRYIGGEVSRLSPEAPVPVVRVGTERLVAGGAGNVAANLAGLGLPLFLIGSAGEDREGEALLSLPVFERADRRGMRHLGATTVKTRVLGGGRQQMLRLDREEIISPAPRDIALALSDIKRAAAAGARFIVLSDYGKGFCSADMCRAVIDFARGAGLPLWVDPKKDDWEPYRGAYAITPNMKELAAACGRAVPNEDGAVAEAARELASRYGIENVLATRSEKGATLVSRGLAEHIPASPVDVFDVSGAGDTMLATAAAFSAAGLSLREAASVANAASQIVIGKVGTCPITAPELLRALASRDGAGCLYSADEAEALCRGWREAGEKIVFTNGCFDILHAGHADSLAAAKALGDRLIVGLNSDASVKRLKGPSRPVNGELSRAKVLAALKAVDAVVLFDEETPAALLSRLRPDVLAKGGDYRPEEIAGREYAGRVVILPLTEGYSTTSVIERISRLK